MASPVSWLVKVGFWTQILGKFWKAGFMLGQSGDSHWLCVVMNGSSCIDGSAIIKKKGPVMEWFATDQ